MKHLYAPLFESTIYDEQHKLEQQAVQEGARRYRDLVRDAVERGEGSQLVPSQRLLAHWFGAVESACKADRRRAQHGGTDGGIADWGPFFQQLKPELLATIGLSSIINLTLLHPGGVKMRRLAFEIGNTAIAEIIISRGQEDDPAGLRAAMEQHKNPSPGLVTAWGKREGYFWKMRHTYAVGGAILHNMLELCTIPVDGEPVPAFNVTSQRTGGKRTVRYVSMADHTWQVIEDGHEVRQYIRPRYLPMVCPLVAWSDDGEQMVKGGYLKLKQPLVRRAPDLQGDFSEVYECLNALNSTPLHINRWCLDQMMECHNRGGGCIGVPKAEDIEMPPPIDSEDETKIRASKARRAEVHRQNIQLRTLRNVFAAKLSVASQMADYPAIYQPHMLDFRGRAYPMPQPLNHQGDDVSRGLLEMSIPEHPDYKAIKINLANYWGQSLDKTSYENRVDWADSHMERITNAGTKGIDDDWWQLAEKPWQFLTACRAMVCPDAAARYITRQDGTLNGLQHYSAMGRDPIGAKITNLMPGDTPCDGYTEITEKARTLAEGDGTELAAMALELMTRKVCKQPVMTKFYGATEYGARKQVLDKIRERCPEGAHRVADYIAKRVLDSVGSLCPAAFAIMEWIVGCASEVVSTGKPLQWTTPLGLPVQQAYTKANLRYVVSKGLQFKVYSPRKEIKRMKQINGSSPNFVHSIDATHMMMTARSARQQNVDMIEIHDDYGSHSGNYFELGRILREEFVNLHSRPLMDEWRTQLEEYAGIELPAPPERGSFALDSVMHSRYAFS